MYRLVLMVVGAGALVGLLMPSPEPRKPLPEPLEAKAEARPSASSPARRWGDRETRIRRADDGHFYVDAIVNGRNIRFLVDTGATAVALTLEDARRVGAHVSPVSFEVVGTGASGPVRGQKLTLDRVELDGKSVSDVPAAAVEGLHVSLLGQTFLSEMEMVQMSGSEMIIR